MEFQIFFLFFHVFVIILFFFSESMTSKSVKINGVSMTWQECELLGTLKNMVEDMIVDINSVPDEGLEFPVPGIERELITTHVTVIKKVAQWFIEHGSMDTLDVVSCLHENNVANIDAVMMLYNTANYFQFELILKPLLQYVNELLPTDVTELQALFGKADCTEEEMKNVQYNVKQMKRVLPPSSDGDSEKKMKRKRVKDSPPQTKRIKT